MTFASIHRGQSVSVDRIAGTVIRTDADGAHLLGAAFMVGLHNWITSYHVVAAGHHNIGVALPRRTGEPDYQQTDSEGAIQYINVELVAADPIRDLCILASPRESEVTEEVEFGSTDELSPGSPVATYGFPHADFGRMVLTRQDTTVGARVLINHQGIDVKHFVLNIQARPGQSGGPVVSTATGRVVAVVVGSYAPGGGGSISLGGVDPATLHQTTHAVSAEYISGMFK